MARFEDIVENTEVQKDTILIVLRKEAHIMKVNELSFDIDIVRATKDMRKYDKVLVNYTCYYSMIHYLGMVGKNM